MIKLIREERIQEFVETLIRVGSYACVASIGWKVTNKIAEHEIEKNNKVNELEMEVLELKHDIVRGKIYDIKWKTK